MNIVRTGSIGGTEEQRSWTAAHYRRHQLIARHGERPQRRARSTTGAASLGKATLGEHLEKTRGPKEGAGEGRGKGERKE